MKKHWLTAIIMAALLLVQAVVICGGALAEGEEHVHTPSGWKHDEFTHWRDCTECGETLLSEVGEHVLEANDRGNYSCVCGYKEDHLYDPDTTQWVCDEMTLTEFHYQPCKVCRLHHGNIEGHDYLETPDSSGNFVCEKCGYKRSHIEHKWSNEWTAVPNEHFHVCEYEDCNVHDNETAAAHTWQETENGTYICTTCGFEIGHEHEADTIWSVSDKNHWHKCTHEGCEWNFDFGVHEMIADAKIGGSVCRVCGYTVIDHDEHVWGDWQNNDRYHWKECTVFSCHAEGNAGEHTMKENADGMFECTTCGYKRTHESHWWETNWQHDDEWHWVECEYANCTAVADKKTHDWTYYGENRMKCIVCGFTKEIEVQPHDEHDVAKWWVSDDEAHWHPCTYEDCNWADVKIPHTWIENDRGYEVCSVCGRHKCEAGTEMGSDENYHWYKCKAIKHCDTQIGLSEHEMVADEEKGCYVCTVCGYEKTHEHDWDKWYHNEYDHWRRCKYLGCDASQRGSHNEVDDGDGVKCTVCTYTRDHKDCVYSEDWMYNENAHWHGCTLGSCYRSIDRKRHVYETNEDGVLVCVVCKISWAETRPDHEHEPSDEWFYNSESHYHPCKYCGNIDITYAITYAHTWVDGENGYEVCSVCGRHKCVSDGNIQSNDQYHWYGCSYPGCEYGVGYEKHQMVEDTEKGGYVCTVCGYERDHEHAWDGKRYYDAEKHYLDKCTICGIYRWDEAHSMFTNVMGISVCEHCGYHIHDWSADWDKDETQHWHACTNANCGWTYDEAEHTWGEWIAEGTFHERECKVCHRVQHENHDLTDGKCDICGFTMHGAQDEWKNDENTHWHGCKFDGCEEKYDEAEHTWSAWEGHGTYHESHCTAEGCDGVEKASHDVPCKICGYGVQPEHTFSDEWSYDEVDHWHACTEEGCNWTKDQAEHEWSEWEGHGTYHEHHCTVCEKTERENHELPDGKCDKCGYTMHGAKNEWKYDETNHWHGCKFDGCEEKFNEEQHAIIGGKCKCGYEQKHEFSDEWSSDETHHWHACTEEGCNWTKDQAEHEWSEWEGHGTYHEHHCTVCEKTERENHELPDGKCDKCDYTMHGAKNEWKYDETNHWHECLFEGCTEKLGEAKHNFVNGVCECGYKQQINNPVKDEEVTPVIPAPMPPQTGDASWLAVGIGMIAAAVCIALRKKQSN